MAIENKYRYKLTDPNGDFFATPLGELSVTLDWSKPDGERFSYDFKIGGKLKFLYADYMRLKALEQGDYKCTPINIVIQRRGSNAWIDIATGTLSLTNGKWDLDKCIYEASFNKPSPEGFLKRTDDVDLFKIIPETSRITVSVDPIPDASPYEDYTIETYAINNQPIGSFFQGEDFVYGGPWIRPPGTSGNAVYDTPQTSGYVKTSADHHTDIGDVGEQKDFRRDCSRFRSPAYSYSEIYTRYIKFIPPAEELPIGAIDLNETRPADNYKKIARVPAVSPDWTIGSTTGTQCNHIVNYYRPELDPPGSGTTPTGINYDNGLTLSQVLSELLAPYGLLPKSNFFNIRPDDTVHETINYVTHKASTTANIVLFQKSDIKRHDAGENATVFKLSLKNLISWLVKMFNVRYGVSGADFIIEHVSIISKNKLLDTTTDPLTAGMRRYSYMLDSIPEKEVFSFMEKRPDAYGINDFNGLPIQYQSSCLKNSEDQREITYAVDKVTTDIKYINDLGEASDLISEDGFVMVACNNDSEGGLHIMRSYSILSSDGQSNNVFGWAHLHNDFWKYDRFMNIGRMNGVLQPFISPKPIIKGEKIKIVKCDIENFDPNTLVKTGLGTGQIEAASYNLSRNTLELEVAYQDVDTFVKVQIVPQVVVPGTLQCSDPVRYRDRNVHCKIVVKFFSDAAGLVPKNVNLFAHKFEMKYTRRMTETYYFDNSQAEIYFDTMSHYLQEDGVANSIEITGLDFSYEYASGCDGGTMLKSEYRVVDILGIGGYTII